MTTEQRQAGGSTRVRLPLPMSFSPGRRGIPPSVDLVHPRRGRHQGTGLDAAVVDCALYAGGRRHGGQIPLDRARDATRTELDGFVWIGLHEPDEASLQAVAEEFGLHPLAVEDAVHAHQRPKLETYGDTLFLILKTVRYLDATEVIETGELMLFVGPDFVVTVRHGEASGLRDVRRDLEARPELLSIGPAAVLYAVVDRVVDGYAPSAEAVEQDVDEIEDEVFSDTRKQPTERIYKLKREVMEFRRAVEPLAPATAALAAGEVKCIATQTAEYFRDVHDHVQRAVEQVTTMSELLDNALASNLAQVQLQQNEDVRRISAWVSIAAVCTLIAGVYGMNFEHMPELGWVLGYPFALALMTGISLLLYRGFRRNHWL